VLAQAAPPAAGTDTDTREADPPGRVARLNYTAGTVTSEPAGDSDWSYAQINRPLTTGDQLWNDEGARSELHIGSTAVRLGSSTSLAILALDDSRAQLRLAQGTLSMRVRELPPGSAYEIDTPNAALAVTAPGDVRIDAAPDGSATTVTVRSGGVTAYGDNGSVQLAGGQQITFGGTALQQMAAGAVPALDPFDHWATQRDAAEDRSVSARYVSRDIPGYQDLDANGTWQSSPDYGQVWVPNGVAPDWAPYQQGHWAWQAPWGWTWIDDAPWGFAPYHYGRWAYIGSQWAWVPGPLDAAPPAYAPALVTFVGDGGSGIDWGVSLAIGGAVGVGVAWFPLGPGEAWRPRHEGWSPRYYDRVNRGLFAGHPGHGYHGYVNYGAPRAVSGMPATGFVRGQPAGRERFNVDPSRWRNPHFMAGTPGIAPTRESFASGTRRADYRPPSGAFARPVVATRAPVAPPAFHDTLAQRLSGNRDARVPGAGAPVARTAPPAELGNRGYSPAMQGRENVRLVATHGPARALENAALAPRSGVPQPPAAHQHAPHPGIFAGGAPSPAPGAGQPGNVPPAAGGARQEGSIARPPAAAAGQFAASPPHDNGVPRPPQSAQPYGRDGMHVPPAETRSYGQQAPVPMHGQAAANGQHGAAWESSRDVRMTPPAHDSAAPVVSAPRAATEARPPAQPPHAMPPMNAPQAREPMQPHYPQQAPQHAPQPAPPPVTAAQPPREHVGQHYAQEAPRPQFHPQQPPQQPPQQQPAFRPQQQMHQEARPQPQPQQHQAQPQPQQQPHREAGRQEPHANHAGDDHHRG
jgi:hypothetical protein